MIFISWNLSTKKKYEKSQDRILDQMRDVPEVSGSIIWAKQIETQLDTYIARVESVLGKSWVQHVDGRRLHRHSVLFRENLQPIKIFGKWVNECKSLSRDVDGKIFKIEEDMMTHTPYLSVNFDQKNIHQYSHVS